MGNAMLWSCCQAERSKLTLEVGHEQVGGLCVAWDQAVLECSGGEGPVVASAEAGGGDDGDGGLVERWRGDPASAGELRELEAEQGLGHVGVKVCETHHDVLRDVTACRIAAERG